MPGRAQDTRNVEVGRAAAELAKATGRPIGYYEEPMPGEPAGYMSVQGEVGRALASPADFLDVPRDAPDFWRKTSGLHRDTPDDSRPAWVVRDGNYVSGRWPGDMHELMRRFIELLPAV